MILFTIFALHHSIMARTGAKAWITRLSRPVLERSVYVWIASLLFLAVCWLWQPLPGRDLADARPRHSLLYVAQAFGVVLTIAAARIVGVWELAGVKQPDPPQPIEFKADGPFAIVRHPDLPGLGADGVRDADDDDARLLFAVISTVYLVAAIPFEETLARRGVRRQVRRVPGTDAVAADTVRLVVLRSFDGGFYGRSTDRFYDRGSSALS